MKTINCKGHLIDLEVPKVMGILNLTPDSFFDGGKYNSEKEAIQHTEKMLNEGADFIDIGAYSSRPGAKNISEKEELQRILPVIQFILKEFPEILISVDTFRSEVARKCIEAGACMINDISGGNLDKEMFNTVAELQVPYILMHMPGTPQTMQKMTKYNDVTKDLIYYFSKKLAQLRDLGVNDIILDAGFGFGKTLDQNYELLKNLDLFKTLDLPILTGVSRKSMLYKLLDITPEDALNATSIVNTIALIKGTHILRVHDVKQAVESVKILQKIK
ncbi:MAG: dihydropteroate synthase [Flavobacteriia bacterium]|nr:MAG: dihydropteroate synthase [Flavobacteriia bacterium]